MEPEALEALAARSPLGVPTIPGVLFRVAEPANAETAFRQYGLLRPLTDREVPPTMRRSLPTDRPADPTIGAPRARRRAPSRRRASRLPTPDGARSRHLHRLPRQRRADLRPRRRAAPRPLPVVRRHRPLRRRARRAGPRTGRPSGRRGVQLKHGVRPADFEGSMLRSRIRRRLAAADGFTLVELLVVVLIIGDPRRDRPRRRFSTRRSKAQDAAGQDGRVTAAKAMIAYGSRSRRLRRRDPADLIRIEPVARPGARPERHRSDARTFTVTVDSASAPGAQFAISAPPRRRSSRPAPARARIAAAPSPDADGNRW